jgi:hypothetical protein
MLRILPPGLAADGIAFAMIASRNALGTMQDIEAAALRFCPAVQFSAR